jgi:serine/threonine protein kinase
MGLTLAAIDTRRNNNQVAVKIFSEDLDQYPEILPLLKSDIDKASELDHPYLHKTLEVGELEHGRLFVVRENIEGESLEDFISQPPGGLDLMEATPIIIQVLEALSYLHSKGLCYRDLTPSNIIRLSDGTIKLANVSEAKALFTDAALRSRESIQTPLSYRYSAPEEVRGFPPPPKGKRGGSDQDLFGYEPLEVYKATNLFYFLLLGKVAHRSERTVPAYASKIIFVDLPDISEKKPEVRYPFWLKVILEGGTIRDSEKRSFQTVDELKDYVEKKFNQYCERAQNPRKGLFSNLLSAIAR